MLAVMMPTCETVHVMAGGDRDVTEAELLARLEVGSLVVVDTDLYPATTSEFVLVEDLEPGATVSPAPAAAGGRRRTALSLLRRASAFAHSARRTPASPW